MIKRFSSTISKLISNHKPRFSMNQLFYIDNKIFNEDIKNVWKKNWIFAGHTCEIKNPGDYMLYNIGNDSAIISRGVDGKIRGFHNVCRHRGSKICKKEKGNRKSFVCPYHQWSYDSTTGKLRNIPFSNEKINLDNYNLQDNSSLGD